MQLPVKFTATWPMPTIRANVLAIMSFNFNRVYTNGTGKGYVVYHHTSMKYHLDKLFTKKFLPEYFTGSGCNV